MVRDFFKPLRSLLHGISLTKEKTPQCLDLLLSFGERASALVLAELLNSFGIPAIFVDSRDWLVRTALSSFPSGPVQYHDTVSVSSTLFCDLLHHNR